MKIKKICGIFAVAISLFGIGSSNAEPYYCTGSRADLVADIQEFARFVRCDGYPSSELAGQWNAGDPVWQWRGTKGNGCEVHWKLSKQLDEENDSGGDKAKGKNANRGAAASLADNKDIYAYDQLTNFVETIKFDAKLRSDDHPMELSDGTVVLHKMADHQRFADDFVAEALQLQKCIGKLVD